MMADTSRMYVFSEMRQVHEYVHVPCFILKAVIPMSSYTSYTYNSVLVIFDLYQVQRDASSNFGSLQNVDMLRLVLINILHVISLMF